MKEAMEIALEALKDSQDYIMGRAMTVEAAETLEEALAKQEQGEPVAWMDRDGDLYKKIPSENWHPPHTPLYTTPQPKQEQDEPVAWRWWIPVVGGTWEVNYSDERPTFAGKKDITPLYEIAPKQRKPLTDEQIADAMTDFGFTGLPFETVIRFFRVCEAAHGIKE